MVQFDGLRPARLKVGIISAGRVGTALGVALERVDHVVVACSAVSRASRQRAERWLPDTPVTAVPDVAGNAELLLLAVPDTELAGLVSGLAATSAVRPGTIVAHTSGFNGVDVLAPLSAQDCIPLAIHPAMTFTGSDEDISRLPDTCFGITAASDVTRSRNPSCSRSAASRSGSPSRPARCTTPHWPTPATTSSPWSPTLWMLCGRRCRAPNCSVNNSSTTNPAASPSASWDRSLARHWRTRCSAGRPHSPGRIARGDAGAVADHLSALEAVDPQLAQAYRVNAMRTAQRVHAPEDVLEVLAR